MACSVCREAGHHRGGHYVGCVVCKKGVFFYKIQRIPSQVRCESHKEK